MQTGCPFVVVANKLDKLKKSELGPGKGKSSPVTPRVGTRKRSAAQWPRSKPRVLLLLPPRCTRWQPRVPSPHQAHPQQPAPRSALGTGVAEARPQPLSLWAPSRLLPRSRVALRAALGPTPQDGPSASAVEAALPPTVHVTPEPLPCWRCSPRFCARARGPVFIQPALKSSPGPLLQGARRLSLPRSPGMATQPPMGLGS